MVQTHAEQLTSLSREDLTQLEEMYFTQTGNPVPMSLFRGKVILAESAAGSCSLLPVAAQLACANGATMATRLDDPSVTHVLMDPDEPQLLPGYVASNQERVAAGLPTLHIVDFRWAMDSLESNEILPERAYYPR